jgi:hypothetical protein
MVRIKQNYKLIPEKSLVGLAVSQYDADTVGFVHYRAWRLATTVKLQFLELKKHNSSYRTVAVSRLKTLDPHGGTLRVLVHVVPEFTLAQNTVVSTVLLVLPFP